ncbi:hypothetical protein L211DRAFT_783095 [Terfezia boudieri ATCC MYA-4762]|uniref:WD-like domain-containing protein n=1 Tax=Terfezia boudieri ATCC MYA-4762 TaxID=1051890 RepID=A0A3N4LRI8_9PEZI|nr:hypothetical protein L211DRAFT_783095 [Terfezia boudieri ATCC MYA-4762]
MLFTNAVTLAIVVITMGAIQSHAGPIIPRADEELVVISVETIGDQTLHWYGLSNDVPTPAPLTKKACGDNIVTCSGSRQASTISCRVLLNTLKSSGGNTVPRSPRAVCLSQSGNQCCTSWAKEMSNPLYFRNLAPAVEKIINNCAGGNVSGLTRDTNLAGTCTTQCLSNRPNGCS